MNTKNIIQIDNNKNIKFSTTSVWVDSIFK